MRNTITINGKDAYTTWGVTMSADGLANLMTPPSLKEWTTNEIRSEDGIRYLVNDTPKLASREVTLTLNMVANNEEAFLTQYAAFCDELKGGKVYIQTSFQPNTRYKFLYSGIQQFSQFNRRIAIFGLRLVEPNPNDRTI